MRCQEADLREQTGTLAALGEFIRHPPVHRRDVIDRGEVHRHERVARREQIAVVLVLGDQVVDDGPHRLFARIGERAARDGRICHRILRQAVEALELHQVFEERAHTVFEPRALQHRIDDLLAAFASLQLAAFRRTQQLIVRCRIPQEEAQARCQRVGIEALATLVLRIRLGDDR